MESASFEDAQRDASLHAVDVGLNASVAAKATLGNGAPHERYTHGTEHYRLSKEAAIQRETQREKELEDERREARKRSELEAKRRAKAQREKEEREKAIREAIQRHRRIVFLQQKGLEEAALFSQWALGKENSKVLGRQVQALWQHSRPSKRQMQAREGLVQDAQRAIQQRWPGCGLILIPFGSTRTGLMEASSDVDLMLFDPLRPLGVGTPTEEVRPSLPDSSLRFLADSTSYGIERLPDYYSVRSVARALERLGKGKFRQVIPITRAKVPIVKLFHAPSRLSSDINVNDAFGGVNSDLIRAYCDVNPNIVRPLIFFIKKWASRRSINDPAGKSGMCSLNSYTICLIAIQYLQIRKIVPNLQSSDLLAALKMPPSFLWQKPLNAQSPTASMKDVVLDDKTGARRFETTFAKLNRTQDWAKAEETARPVAPTMLQYRNSTALTGPALHHQLGQLLCDFFIWLSDFDFDKCGISIRMGCPFRKTSNPVSDHLRCFPYLEPPSKEWRNEEPLLCQDPFIVDRNTSGAIRLEMRKIIVDECWRAKALLGEEQRDQTTKLAHLLEDYELEKLTGQHNKVMDSFDQETQARVAEVGKTPPHSRS